MVCDKCGTEVTKNDKFCPKCGAKVIKKRNKKKDIPEVEKYTLKDKEIEHLSQSFVSRDEKYIASLGNGYIMNYLTNKSMKKGFAFLTDKRVYFKGTCLSGKGKFLVRTDEERTVDVKNITGSGFVYRRYWGILLTMIMSLIAVLAGTVWAAVTGIAMLEDRSGRWNRYNKQIDIYEAVLDELDTFEWENDERHFTGRGMINVKGEEFSVYIESDYSYTSYNDVDMEDNNIFCFLIEKYDDEKSVKKAAKESLDKEINRCKKRRGTSPAIVAMGEIITAGLFLSVIAIICIGIKNYLLKRKTLFRIEYAGGCIAFDVSFYAKAEIDDFQKQLRRVKDFAEETATIKTVAVETPVQAPTQSSVPDDLRKYADLLKEGLISQEEYDAMKKKILGL